MTFEEWLKTQPILGDSHTRIARLAWEAAWGASQEQFIEDCEIVADNAADAASYSMTPMRLRFFTMGTKTVLRDLKARLRV
jgi:hypothetical protein